MRFVIVDRDHVTVHTLFQHKCLSTGTNMLLHERVTGIHRHITKRFRFRVVGHLQTEIIICVKDDSVFGNFDRDALDYRKLFKRIDAT
jgi:hypothetical protein